LVRGCRDGLWCDEKRVSASARDIPGADQAQCSTDGKAGAMRRWLLINLEPVLFREPKEASGLGQNHKASVSGSEIETCRRRR